MSLSKTLKIAVLCGGLSSEREVSLRSGRNCLAALHRLGYANAFQLDVGRDVAQKLAETQTEAAFLALHGRYGEDGCIQGLLELMGIPYTGNGVAASALTMDKVLTKRLLKEAGLPVLPTVTVVVSPEGTPDTTAVDALGYPVMVKPLSEGSSVGMSKVNAAAELPAALKTAAPNGGPVLIEPFVTGRSLTIGIIDIDGQPTVTPILEFRTKTEWYDLEAKYTPGVTEFILPANLSDQTTVRLQETSLLAHQSLGCYGVSRVDWVIDADDKASILEVNTIPGMTDLSDLPAQAQAMGIAYDELVHHILQTAFRR